MLQTLDVSSNEINLHPWGVVATCNWAQLDISDNGMDCDKLAELVCADSPVLEDLHLSGPLDAECIDMLVNEHWPQLRKLEILRSNLDDSLMGVLATADWPSLSCLELHGLSQLTNQGIRHLLEADWPLIRRLALWSFASEYGSFSLLAKKWPQLQFLGLGRISRDGHEAVPRDLPDWLQIRELHLACAGLDAHAVKLLSSGQNCCLSSATMIERLLLKPFENQLMKAWLPSSHTCSSLACSHSLATSPTHSLTSSCTHSLTHPPTHSLTHSPTRPPTHSLRFTHFLAHPPVHLFACYLNWACVLTKSCLQPVAAQPTHSCTSMAELKLYN